VTPRVTVVGLGPAGPELLTAGTLDALASAPVTFLRTSRHPAAAAVGAATSFDHHYDTAAAIGEVYQRIVEDLVGAAAAHGHVLYAVPGSPAVAERTVELLRSDPRVDVDVLPALSCVDLAWTRLGVDPLSVGPRIVDGHRFAEEAAGERGPLLVLQCDGSEVGAAIKLAVDDLDPDGGRPGPVTVLHHLGLADERIEVVAWDALDRLVADHLTMVWIPTLAAPVGRELVRFAELVRTLRERCPWDAEQTHTSLRRYLLEETYEVLEAIDGLGRGPDDGWGALEDELGDLLFQVVFHAALASEEGAFDLADVARGIHDKLVRRHPHVFADVEASTPGAVVRNWDAIKRQEQADRAGRERSGERAGALDGVPAVLPALQFAEKLQRRAAGVGFDWPDVEGAWPKIAEEAAELREARAAGDPGRIEAELGDLLFACVNVARHLGVDAEGALRQAAGRFRTRFEVVERLAERRGVALPGAGLAVLDALWDEAKVQLGPG